MRQEDAEHLARVGEVSAFDLLDIVEDKEQKIGTVSVAFISS